MVEHQNTSSEFLTDYLFTGHELDRETNLYYAHARYLNPRLGVWLSVDPLAEKYPNASPYNYCLGNPINMVDLDGKDWVTRVVDGVREVYYDRDVKSQADVLKKYGKNGGVTHLNNGDQVGKYTFYNDDIDNKYGAVYENNSKKLDGSKILYKNNLTIFGVTDDSVNAETLHKNLMGTSYTGGDNPKDYRNRDSFQYRPNNESEFYSIIHDLRYDKAKTKGLGGALLDTRVVGADALLSLQNFSLLARPEGSLKDKGRALATGAAFGLIATYKAGLFVMGLSKLKN